MNLDSRNLKKIYVISGIILLGILIFTVGIKSWFFDKSGEVYYFGEITKIIDNSFTIKGREFSEKIIIINNDTVVRKKSKIAKEELEVGNYVIIVGLPNGTGQIKASLVRILSENDFEKYR